MKLIDMEVVYDTVAYVLRNTLEQLGVQTIQVEATGIPDIVIHFSDPDKAIKVLNIQCNDEGFCGWVEPVEGLVLSVFYEREYNHLWAQVEEPRCFAVEYKKTNLKYAVKFAGSIIPKLLELALLLK